MTLTRLACAFFAFACWTPAHACSPPPETAQAGFVRHDVGHLPANAKGVMFLGENGSAAADAFRLTVDTDPRLLRLRVDAPMGQSWSRLEPVDGFRSGRRYHFAYLPKHTRWRYPDRMDVVIDAARVDPAGVYVIERKGDPHPRAIGLRRGPSCVETAAALVQDFGYRTPPGLAAYHKALDYRAEVRVEATPPDKRQPDRIPWENGGPRPYADGTYGLVSEDSYTTIENAVVAPCGLPRSRIVLRGWIGFPEVDWRYADTAPVTFDMDGTRDGQCERLPALLQTMRDKGTLWTVRTLCHFDPVTGTWGSPPSNSVSAEEKQKSWELHLWQLQTMNDFCTLAALGYAWREGYLDTRPASMRRLGEVVAKAAGWAEPSDQRELPVWLDYIVSQLPSATRAATSQPFLAPMQPALARILAMPMPFAPTATARLIAAGGKLEPEVGVTLRGVAARQTEAGRLARALLAADR